MKLVSEQKITKSQIQKLADNLQMLMSERGITESDLAKLLELPVMTIRRIVSGETIDPRISTLKLIADYFEVTIDELLAEADYKRVTALANHHQPQFVPILDWKTVSTINFSNNINLKSWNKWQPVIINDKEKLSLNAFALESRPSMQPRFPLGTIFIIEPNETPADGDLILIKIKNTNDLSLRELVIDPPKWQLTPIVAGSETIFYEKSQHTILGVIMLTLLYTRKEMIG